MHDVAVYLGTLPKIANHSVKQQVMQAFAEGAAGAGASVSIVTARHPIPARLAVMIGWFSHAGGGPHIHFRQTLVDYQRDSGHKIMPIDGSCFKFADINTRWLRYSVNSIFWNEGEYANHDGLDARHWGMIQADHGVTMQPWRSSGSHVLICLQRDGGWSSKGFDQDVWLKKVIKTLRSHTDRPIVVRPHPAAKNNYNHWAQRQNIQVSTGQRSLQQDLINAHAAVFWNSSSAVAAVLAGVPVFVQDAGSVAWAVSNQDLATIESPSMPDRTQWINTLSQAHWNLDQSRRGDIYRKFLPYLR